MSDADIAADTKCPHCGGTLGFEVATKLMSESRVSFSLHPHEGEHLSASTVGLSIDNISSLLKAVGDDLGIKTDVLVSGMQYLDGGVTVDLIVARSGANVEQRQAAE